MMKIRLNPLSLQANIPPAFVAVVRFQADTALPKSAQETVVRGCLEEMDKIRILALQYRTIWMLKHSVVFTGIPSYGYVGLYTIFREDRFWEKPSPSKHGTDREDELSPALNPFKKWLEDLGLEFSVSEVIDGGQEGLLLMVKKPSNTLIRSLFGSIPNEDLVLKGNKKMLRNETSPEYQFRKRTYGQFNDGCRSIDSWVMAALIPLQLRIASLLGKDWVSVSLAWRKKNIVRKKSVPLDTALQQAKSNWEKDLLLLRERLLGLGYEPVFKNVPVVLERRGMQDVQAFGVAVPK